MALNAIIDEKYLQFYPVKNRSVDVTFTRAITHQKHFAQSGCSTRSAVDIFNTLRVFTRAPTREQEVGVYEWKSNHVFRTSKVLTEAYFLL